MIVQNPLLTNINGELSEVVQLIQAIPFAAGPDHRANLAKFAAERLRTYAASVERVTVG